MSLNIKGKYTILIQFSYCYTVFDIITYFEIIDIIHRRIIAVVDIKLERFFKQVELSSKDMIFFNHMTFVSDFYELLNRQNPLLELQGVKFLFFPIFSYFSQHTPIFPIF